MESLVMKLSRVVPDQVGKGTVEAAMMAPRERFQQLWDVPQIRELLSIGSAGLCVTARKVSLTVDGL